MSSVQHYFRSSTPPSRGSQSSRVREGTCCQHRRHAVESAEKENLKLLHLLKQEREERLEAEKFWKEKLDQVAVEHKENLSKMGKLVACQKKVYTM